MGNGYHQSTQTVYILVEWWVWKGYHQSTADKSIGTLIPVSANSLVCGGFVVNYKTEPCPDVRGMTMKEKIDVSLLKLLSLS